MAGFLQVVDGRSSISWRGHERGAKSSTRKRRKISIALINIPLGKNCLVRQRAAPAIFSRVAAFFSERNSESFGALVAPAPRRIAKYPAKHSECAPPNTRDA